MKNQEPRASSLCRAAGVRVHTRAVRAAGHVRAFPPIALHKPGAQAEAPAATTGIGGNSTPLSDQPSVIPPPNDRSIC